MSDTMFRKMLAEPLKPRTDGAKVLVADIETSPAEVYTFGLFNQNIGIGQVKSPGHVLSFAAKWLGEEEVEFRSTFHDGKDAMVERAWHLLNEADAVVHYNGARFDIPHLYREFLLAELPPPSPHKDIDLLRTARGRFKFLSNKLDFVSQSVGIGEKVKHEGFGLWLACLEGDKDAWERMKTYNVGDVVLTENLYLRLLPWIKAHPALGILTADDELNCAKCGSHDLDPAGTFTADLLVYQRYRCRNCSGWVRGARHGRASTTRGI